MPAPTAFPGVPIPLDPRAPLVVDTRELGRRPGTMRKLTRVVPAPADLGIDVIHVPAGSDLELTLRLEAVMEGVLVSGRVWGRLAGECVRCLDPLEQDLDVDFQELYAYDGDRSGDADEDVRTLEGDLLDLEVAVRDAVVLALPLAPVCTQECPGLCPDCGARLADDQDHRHETVDSRWAALHSMFDEERES